MHFKSDLIFCDIFIESQNNGDGVMKINYKLHQIYRKKLIKTNMQLKVKTLTFKIVSNMTIHKYIFKMTLQ